MKQFLAALMLLFTITTAQAQFRLISNGVPSWTTVNDSTYTATVNFQADQTGFGYLATNIADTFRVFTGTEQLYQVTVVANTTFSSADLTVVELSNQYTTTDGPPAGQVMVYDPAAKETLPQNPFGSTGSTAQIQAAVDTYNARIRNMAEPGVGGQPYNGIIYDTLSVGGVTVEYSYEAFVPNNISSLANPAAGTYQFTIAKDVHVHEFSIFGDNTTLNANQEIVFVIENTANGAPRRVSVQLYDANNNALVDQQITGTVHTQVTSGTTVTVTIPGLNGFGATGYRIELR